MGGRVGYVQKSAGLCMCVFRDSIQLSVGDHLSPAMLHCVTSKRHESTHTQKLTTSTTTHDTQMREWRHKQVHTYYGGEYYRGRGGLRLVTVCCPCVSVTLSWGMRQSDTECPMVTHGLSPQSDINDPLSFPVSPSPSSVLHALSSYIWF